MENRVRMGISFHLYTEVESHSNCARLKLHMAMSQNPGT